jgi:hypothetical protein
MTTKKKVQHNNDILNPLKNCEEYRCCVANAVGSISSNTVQNVKIQNLWKLSVVLLYGNCLDKPNGKNITDLSDYISATTQYYDVVYSSAVQELININSKVKFAELEEPYPDGYGLQFL